MVRRPVDAFAKEFGARLRSLRLKAGLSQEEVAARATVHVTYLSGIERGQRNPTLKSIRRVAAAIGVPLKELFVFEDPAC